MFNNHFRSSQTTAEHASHHRRGTVVPLAAAMMAVLLGMVAFAIDIGNIVHVDTELQRTADACALAAVQALPDQDAAIAVAQQVAIDNFRTSGPELDASDIEFGHWDDRKAQFTVTTSNPNGVRITVRRTAARGNPLSLFFAPVLGHRFADVSASSIAMYDKEFCGPLVGIDWIEVPGGPITDSYYSSRGRYHEQKAGNNGSLCSDGPINLDGNPIVNGHANPGRNHETTLSGNAIVTGNTSPRLRPLNLPPVDASEAAEVNNNSALPPIQKGNSLVSPVDTNGNFLLDGGKNYTFPPGTYYLNDFILTGQSTLNFQGPTKIYLTGKLDTAGGNLLNDTRLAANVLFLMTGSTARVTASVDFFGVLYAPNTHITLDGGGDWFGAMVGKTLTATGNGMIHYDEDLDVGDELNLPNRVALVE